MAVAVCFCLSEFVNASELRMVVLDQGEMVEFEADSKPSFFDLNPGMELASAQKKSRGSGSARYGTAAPIVPKHAFATH